ncbi:MAG: type II restriction endonuclease [Bacteroidales bacterium]|nr:type II restriction endonuclease [Bacteroidales bacterium]MCD8394254.1 type II restriction endonuclease [Bacteroidales bacterium]
MKAHTEEEFTTFLSQLVDTNATLSFYTDFPKCYANVNRIAIKLNQLNYLIGKADMDEAIRELWEENPKVFSVLDILIAIRTKDHKKAVDDEGKVRLIESYFDTVDGVIEYIRETGLREVFTNKQITNLVDYVFGVEVGLDSNARKNRSGHIMEGMVADLLTAKGVTFHQEVYSYDFPEIHTVLGEDTKRFDFVIHTPEKTYLIEVNFYSGGGSKLNEVSRAYTELAPKVNSCPGFEFVWITDGIGWHSAKSKLEEAFYTIPSIYNLSTLPKFLSQICSR